MLSRAGLLITPFPPSAPIPLSAEPAAAVSAPPLYLEQLLPVLLHDGALLAQLAVLLLSLLKLGVALRVCVCVCGRAGGGEPQQHRTST